ncbi:MAG: hypothetical protein Q8N14_05025 [Candidatus Omnitrophota bacterium]|nr:hypothetical protein [Candidatus Omnitrophota bacterium]
MSKVARYIIVILAALFLGSLFLALQSTGSKESLLKQYQAKEAELRKATDSLAQQLTAAQSDKRRVQDKMDALQKDFFKITSERDDWKNKYDAIQKEKEQLVSKLQEIPRMVEQPKAATVAQPVTPDEYWAGVIKDKASLELQFKDLQDELSNTKLQMEEVKKNKTEFELELSRLKQVQDDLERKLKYSTDLANTLSLELARDKNDNRYIADKLATIREENAALRAQVKELTTTKVSLQKSLQRLAQERTTLEVQLTKTEDIVQNRINDMLDIKKELESASKARGISGIEGKTVQLPPIIVKAQGKGEVVERAVTDKTARVISVNEPNNFVIIDSGEVAGVKVGDAFKVYRDSKEIAIIEVIQARKDISAADIKQKTQSIQVGDLAK